MDKSDIPKPPAHNTLSEREYQVLYLIASGESVKSVANILDISIQTVHTYRRRVINKFNINIKNKNSDVMLAITAVQKGYISYGFTL